MALPRVMASGFAPGKCILFGEHAVVYGHPAVAVAIESGVRVSVEQSKMGSMWSVISPMHSGVTGSMSPALLTRGKEAAAEPTKGTDSRSNETHTHTHTHTHVWRWWLFL